VTAGRARARDIGLAPGRLPTGPANAVTDVPGIRVGQLTLIEGSDIRTGVTAIVPDTLAGSDPAGRRTLPAGLAVFNGFGKMVGTTQVTELGTIETPVLLTSTLSVFRVADALLSYLHGKPGYADMATLNPVVAETNDGYLSDIWARPITDDHVRAALDGATTGPVAEGCVGAGTGTGALGYKAGIGTSSRVCEQRAGPATLGVLVQANFGGELTVLGVPCPPPAMAAARDQDHHQQAAGNSCVIVLATDAALDSRQLTRLATRAFGGMARTGSDFSGHSGDYALAVSTALPVIGGQQQRAEQQKAADDGGPVPDKDLDLLFLAAIEATEEAILNSLFMAVTTTGVGGRIRYAVPLEYVTARVSGRSAPRYGS
jgi:D-aminopeptidase